MDMIDCRDKTHPRYGEVIYDAGGLLVCHECGKGGFTHLSSHVVKKHGDKFQTVRDYKYTFGLDLNKGLVTPDLKEKMRELCIAKGGIDNLDNTSFRFKKGHQGHPSKMVSEQSKRRNISVIQKVNEDYKNNEGKLRNMVRITITNDFHNSSVNIVPKEVNGSYIISKDRVRKTKKALCGSQNCTCSGVLGNHGNQYVYMLIEELPTGEVEILLDN